MNGIFKENRVIKLCIVLLLLVLFFAERFKQKNEQINGFFHQTSYEVEDEIIFSLIGESDKKSEVYLSSLTNDIRRTLEVVPFKTIENDSVLYYGVQSYTSNIAKIKGLESGIYLINDTIPLVVKAPLKKADVVIVYPYVNNLIKTPYKTRSIGSDKNTFTSIYRSNYVDPISIEMRSFFKEISSKYSVKYIADIDLENPENIADTKLVIFYGDLLYASADMKNNVLSYLEGGGDIMMASTSFFNNVFWMDSLQPETVVLNKKAKDNGVYSQDRYGVSLWEIDRKYIDEYIGFTFANGGISAIEEGYEIILKDSPLFKRLSVSKVPVRGQKYIGLAGRNENYHFTFDLPDDFNVKVHAFLLTEYNNKSNVSGIIELKIGENSGKILSLGTSQWFSHWNYEKSDDIKHVTLDAVEYLLND